MSPEPQHQQEVLELLSLARGLADRQLHDEAAELLQVALSLSPENADVSRLLAEVRQCQGQSGRGPTSIRETLQEQFRRNVIDAAHFLGLAHLYAEKGQDARAIQCLEVAKAKDVANPSPLKLHGRILLRRKDYDGAAEQFYQAQRFNPFDREIAESLWRIEYDRKQFKEALKATIHAFLLLKEGDRDGATRLKRRIRTIKRILGLDRRQLLEVFQLVREDLHTAVDRLEWHRERFMEEEGLSMESSYLHGVTPHAERNGSRIKMAARLRRLAVWSHLTDEQIFHLTRAANEEVHDRGGLIFTHASQGEDLYVLERGEVSIQRPTAYGTFNLGILTAGTLFGEANFLSRLERSGDAVATQPSVLLRLGAEQLRELIERMPELGLQLYWSFWHSLAKKLRSTNEQLRSFFSPEVVPENFVRLRRRQRTLPGRVKVGSSDKIRLFREKGLSHSDLATLATFSREKSFPEGAYVFHEGESGEEMYVIVEGRALVSKYIAGAGEEALAILGRGDFFGEMSLIDGEPRSADAKAHGGSLTVLSLDQNTVQDVLSMDPEASLEFLDLLCVLVTQRLREIDEKVIGWRILSGQRSSQGALA